VRSRCSWSDTPDGSTAWPYGITRNDADAEEVVQDAFLALFRKIDSFEGRAGARQLALTASPPTRPSSSTGAKRAKLEVSLEEQLPTYLADGHREGDRSFLLADWSETPEETLLNGEARKTLERALDRLPEHYRAVVVLREVEGLDNEEIAKVLDESVPTVKSRLHRARGWCCVRSSPARWDRGWTS
jgi:RNA polymerase sigma-70 factor (ECF subfamily)